MTKMDDSRDLSGAGPGLQAGDSEPIVATIKLRLRDKHSRELSRQARAVSAKEALRLGLSRYFTGRPCIHGHIAERLACNGTCVICATAIRNRSRQRHPDRLRATNAKYYAANAVALKALNADWRASHREEMRQLKSDHYRANKGAYLARTKLRKAHVNLATPPWVDVGAIKAVYEKAAALTAATGIPHDVDHIEPLRGSDRSGLHVHWNLQPMPAALNRGKHNNPRWQIATHDRDVNAALNIARVGLDTLEAGAPL